MSVYLHENLRGIWRRIEM